MKKSPYFNPFMIPVIELLFFTGNNKADDETAINDRLGQKLVDITDNKAGNLLPGTIYYIDPLGSNYTNNGSIARPWLTLAFACSRAKSSGSTIHVNAGTYLETSQSMLA